jgi:hypothetical protein
VRVQHGPDRQAGWFVLSPVQAQFDLRAFRSGLDIKACEGRIPQVGSTRSPSLARPRSPNSEPLAGCGGSRCRTVAVGYAPRQSPEFITPAVERCSVVPSLTFPAGQAVGTLDWLGRSAIRAAPVLASGVVSVPDGAEISLDVMVVESVRRPDGQSQAFHISSSIQPDRANGPIEVDIPRDSDDSWEITGGTEPADLGFLRDLPVDSVTNLHLRAPIVPESFTAVAHLAPGLRRLYLAWTGLTDDVLASVSKLGGLVYLQSWGNLFTDHGVQQLAVLTALESLYLEEETLSAAAFDFAATLPRLARLGLQDVPISTAELAELRRRLPGIDIG